MLDRLYTKMDDLADLHCVYKLEIIGDAFLCATNLVHVAISYALQLLSFCTYFLLFHIKKNTTDLNAYGSWRLRRTTQLDSRALAWQRWRQLGKRLWTLTTPGKDLSPYASACTRAPVWPASSAGSPQSVLHDI